MKISIKYIKSKQKIKKIFDSMLDFQTDANSVLLGFKQHYIAYSPIAGTNWTLMIAAPGNDFMKILWGSVLTSIVVIIVLQFVTRGAGCKNSR